MDEGDWEELFDMIKMAINIPKLTAAEKAAAIKENAEMFDATGDLEEFIALLKD